MTPEGFSYLKSKQIITFEEYKSLIEISKDGLVSESILYVASFVISNAHRSFFSYPRVLITLL